MAEQLPVPRQTFEVVPEQNLPADVTPSRVTAAEEFPSKWRTQGTVEWLRRNMAVPWGHPADDKFIPWDHMAGHEGDEADLASARSQGEFDEMVRFLERNRQDHYNAENGPLGFVGDLMAGVFDPINLAPIPAVKGIGIFKGALYSGAAVGAYSVGEEYLRQRSDPLAQPEEAFWNIGLGTILGAGIGGVAGGWGAGHVRRANAMREMEASLADSDSPNLSLRPRGMGENHGLDYNRPPPNPDGTRSTIRTVDTVAGYVPKTVDGVRYVSEDGVTWVRAAEAGGRAEPLSVGQDILDELGTPEPITGLTTHVDEAKLKAEHDRGGWHDELQGYVEGETPIERIVLDGNDYVNFRTYEHLWERMLPQNAGETTAEWRTRVGKEAMKEFRASKLPGSYASAHGLEWILERLNFSPVVKLINVFKGDNYVADLALRIGGDYGWAIRGNKFGWSTPPSILLKTMRHTARYKQWQDVFDAEFLKFASGNQGAKGRIFQGLNVGAAGYNKVNGVRRMGGAKVMTKDIFEEMVTEAVFNPNDFSVQGFPVNENARRVAKAFTEMAQEYDGLHRAAGNFRDQKRLQSDIRYWSKEQIRYQDAVMKWLWGATGAPVNMQHAIRVRVPTLLAGGEERIFTGDSHEAAIQSMLDELGDDGVTLSEQLTAGDYGYTYRTGAAPAPVAPAGAAPAVDVAAAAERLKTEDLTEQARLRNLIDTGAATPQDVSAFHAITRKITRWQAEEMGLGPKAARELDLGLDYNPLLEGLGNVRDLIGRIRETVNDPDFLRVADIIEKEAGDVPVDVVHLDQLIADADAGDWAAEAVRDDFRGVVGKFIPAFNEIRLRGRWDGGASGLNVTTVLHEGVHAITSRRIFQGQLDKQAGLDTSFSRSFDRLTELHEHVNTLVESRRKQLFADLDLAGRQDLQGRVDYMLGDPHELLTMALTEKPIRDWLKTIPAGKPRGAIRTAWDEIVHFVLETIGLSNLTPEQVSKFDELLGFTSELTGLEKPGVSQAPGEFASLAPGPPQFTSVGDAMEQRVRAMSPAQKAIFEERAGAMQLAADNRAKAEADLKLVTDQPHQFLNAAGQPEPWYHRVWDKTKAATEREKLTRAIAGWYERDNPDGARSRAEQTLDNILNEDAEIGDGAGMSALRQRTLNIPNSWSIEDPEFGTIKISDFIDKRIRSVAEHYIHRSGAKIETARMFGDSEMRAEKARLREYLLKRYWEPATTDAERAAAMARIEEAEGQLDIINKSVSGTLRTTDPHRLTNRIAAGMKNITTLGTMGKVAISSLGEIVRPGMVNGFGTYFNVLFTKYLDDLEAMRGNIGILQEMNELNDLAMNRMHVQQATIMDGEPALGGTTFEKWINEKAGNLYHIAGLTSLTTWQKLISGLAAQHSVMAEARDVGRAMIAGTPVDSEAVMRLAAMGISARDAVLLSRMPVEHYQGGKLILPAVDSWKGLGADGRRARELLLNGVHAEMRRSIVTPSIGDRSTVFNGVWTHKGKVVFQNDLMSLPMQFLSYGMGAHNKLLTSALQGRDRSTMTGLFYMMLMGIFSFWLLADKNKWKQMTYDQILAEGFERSGVGGFWFNGLNQQIERVSNNRLGYRAMLGIEPTYKRDPAKDASAMTSIGGASANYFYELSRAFWDTSITGSQRAAIIRRGIPYNNVYWWDSGFDTMSSEAGELLGGTRQ